MTSQPQGYSTAKPIAGLLYWIIHEVVSSATVGTRAGVGVCVAEIGVLAGGTGLEMAIGGTGVDMGIVTGPEVQLVNKSPIKAMLRGWNPTILNTRIFLLSLCRCRLPR